MSYPLMDLTARLYTGGTHGITETADLQTRTSVQVIESRADDRHTGVGPIPPTWY